MNFQSIVEQIADEVRGIPPEGRVADYIPELADVRADAFGIALQTVDGTYACVGDSEERFSVQSVAKVFGLALALSKSPEQLWKRVNVEPSGDPFNSLALLEIESGIPRNPLVNAGAIVVCDMLLSLFDDPKAELLSFVRHLAQTPDISMDERVAASEARTGFRNRALAELMRSFGNIHNEVDAVLDLYVHLCAISMSCSELARAFHFLADRGETLPQNVVLGPRALRRINAVMLTCGFYDEAGEFAFSVGLPGKSGVGGGIVAVCPGSYSVASWSPRLTKGGNSFLGMRSLAMLTTLTESSIF